MNIITCYYYGFIPPPSKAFGTACGSYEFAGTHVWANDWNRVDCWKCWKARYEHLEAEQKRKAGE